MVKKPKLLVLDEPGQGLDAVHRHRLLSTVDKVISQTAACLIFVTHLVREMPGCITQVLELKAGDVRKCRPRQR